MPEGAKEPETAQTFDEDEYKSNLIDNEDYSEQTAAIKAKKKKEQLEAQAAKGPVAKMIEINLNDIIEKTQREKMVTVRRGGKTHQRRQKVGKKDGDQTKNLRVGFSAIMDEATKFKSRREFMSAVKTAWTDGEMINVGSENGVVFGNMILTEEILGQLKSDHPYSKLLTYGK